MNAAADRLRDRLRSGDAVLGVIGLGYVGVPLSLAFAEKGLTVLGFDVDRAHVDRLARGEDVMRHLKPGRIKAAVDAGRFVPTTDFERLREPDALLICVPTPLTPQREPDLTYVRGTAEAIRPRLRAGQLVVLESTTYPGTTDELVKPELERSGLRCGEDFFLAFSPEREDPGNAAFGTTTIPKVVGGVDEAAGDLAQALYDRIVVRTVRVSSARAAEATKLVENIFRAVNIALVNELKIIYDRMGLNVWEILDAAATKPFGFMRFDPGPGWGGHCIPLDPFYLSWKAREFGITPKFIELAGDINVGMPEWVLGKLAAALNERAKPLKGSRVLLLGLAYKKDVSDTRESPALEIIRLLDAAGAVVSFHDPFVPELPRTRHLPGREPMRSVPLTPATLQAVDAVLVVTDHTAVDYPLVAREAPVVVDARGVYHRRHPELAAKVRRA